MFTSLQIVTSFFALIILFILFTYLLKFNFSKNKYVKWFLKIWIDLAFISFILAISQISIPLQNIGLFYYILIISYFLLFYYWKKPSLWSFIYYYWQKKKIKKAKEKEKIELEKNLKNKLKIFRKTLYIFLIFVLLNMFAFPWYKLNDGSFMETEVPWYMMNDNWDIIIDNKWDWVYYAWYFDKYWNDWIIDQVRYDLNRDNKVDLKETLNSDWQITQVVLDYSDAKWIMLFFAIVFFIFLFIKVKNSRLKQEQVIASILLLSITFPYFININQVEASRYDEMQEEFAEMSELELLEYTCWQTWRDKECEEYERLANQLQGSTDDLNDLWEWEQRWYWDSTPWMEDLLDWIYDWEEIDWNDPNIQDVIFNEWNQELIKEANETEDYENLELNPNIWNNSINTQDELLKQVEKNKQELEQYEADKAEAKKAQQKAQQRAIQEEKQRQKEKLEREINTNLDNIDEMMWEFKDNIEKSKYQEEKSIENILQSDKSIPKEDLESAKMLDDMIWNLKDSATISKEFLEEFWSQVYVNNMRETVIKNWVKSRAVTARINSFKSNIEKLQASGRKNIWDLIKSNKKWIIWLTDFNKKVNKKRAWEVSKWVNSKKNLDLATWVAWNVAKWIWFYSDYNDFNKEFWWDNSKALTATATQEVAWKVFWTNPVDLWVSLLSAWVWILWYKKEAARIWDFTIWWVSKNVIKDSLWSSFKDIWWVVSVELNRIKNTKWIVWKTWAIITWWITSTYALWTAVIKLPLEWVSKVVWWTTKLLSSWVNKITSSISGLFSWRDKRY